MDASEIDSSKAGALVGTISTLSSKNKIEENPKLNYNKIKFAK